MGETAGQPLDRILEAAVIVSWRDLIPNNEAALVHVEYDFDARGDVTFLRVWSSTVRGFWRLICTHSVSDSQNNRTRFADGFASARLARIFEVAMQHQDVFRPPQNLGRQGLIQIAVPSGNEQADAELVIREAMNHVESGEAVVA